MLIPSGGRRLMAFIVDASFDEEPAAHRTLAWQAKISCTRMTNTRIRVILISDLHIIVENILEGVKFCV